ncbi:hypothetical protein EON77_14835 [bacterium]|nr:MAG: hypothetical protein EON77_14835 [bacterium]
MSDAPILSLALVEDADAPERLEPVPAEPVNMLALDPSYAALSDGLISLSLVDDEPLPQRIAG